MVSCKSKSTCTCKCKCKCKKPKDFTPIAFAFGLTLLNTSDNFTTSPIEDAIRTWLVTNLQLLLCQVKQAHFLGAQYEFKHRCPPCHFKGKSINLYENVINHSSVKSFPCVRNVHLAALEDINKLLEELTRTKTPWKACIQVGSERFLIESDEPLVKTTPCSTITASTASPNNNPCTYIEVSERNTSLRNSKNSKIYWWIANLAATYEVHPAAYISRLQGFLPDQNRSRHMASSEGLKSLRQVITETIGNELLGESEKNFLDDCTELVGYLLPLSLASKLVHNAVWKYYSSEGSQKADSHRFKYEKPLYYWKARFLFHVHKDQDDNSRHIGMVLDTVTGQYYNTFLFPDRGEFMLEKPTESRLKRYVGLGNSTGKCDKCNKDTGAFKMLSVDKIKLLPIHFKDWFHYITYPPECHVLRACLSTSNLA